MSVVVPTHNRSDRLNRLVHALAAQDIDEPFEVVVVDDGSMDGTPAELRRLEEAFSFLRTVRLETNGGPGPARNAGWRAAIGRNIVFTDDDCRPDPGWLHALLGGLERFDVAQGRTMPDQTNLRQIGPFGHTIQVEGETGLYETCNIAYRREVLERLNGFDEQFEYFAEDTDLGWRARDAGYRTTFVESALVVHEVRPSDFAHYMRNVPRIEGIVRAISRHRGVRNSFWHGLFFNEAHPRVLLLAGAGGALLSRPRSPLRWAAVAGAATLYARSAMRVRAYPRRRRDWAWVLPVAVVADLSEVGVLARASLRYRAILL